MIKFLVFRQDSSSLSCIFYSLAVAVAVVILAEAVDVAVEAFIRPF